MLLLLNRAAKLHQLLGNSLPSLLHDLLELTSMTLIPGLKECIGYTILPCTAGPPNSVNIILTVREAKSVSLCTSEMNKKQQRKLPTYIVRGKV